MVVLSRMSTNFSSTHTVCALSRTSEIARKSNTPKTPSMVSGPFSSSSMTNARCFALLPEWWTEDKAEECVKYGEGDG